MALLRVGVVSALLSLALVARGALAQQPVVAAPGQTALAGLAAPFVPALIDAGVQRIEARTGRQWLNVAVTTQWGPVYFDWPTGVSPMPFAIAIGTGGTPAISAPGYADANRAAYASAFDAVLPVAVERAQDARTAALRPRP